MQNKFSITSSDFETGGTIPVKYSYKAENISPDVKWSGAPKGTKSFALIMIDYDAEPVVGFPFVHWIVYDISAEVLHLVPGVKGFKFGMSNYDTDGYAGMNPPAGQNHAYYFHLYALDIEKLEIEDKPSEDDLSRAMDGHILAKTSMYGNFEQ
ncbi:MAG: hypothetical protein A3E88_08055 [Legionellales bacterium RIFCSPHIGHO2_12_FULL_35_11]|nr:MAG: hypothetical protein A3E88_08055 [Legionellales bacterium RIFCSPHIGHO2_12_FULL_35_11]